MNTSMGQLLSTVTDEGSVSYCANDTADAALGADMIFESNLQIESNTGDGGRPGSIQQRPRPCGTARRQR
jgi:hypothetical protein